METISNLVQYKNKKSNNINQQKMDLCAKRYLDSPGLGLLGSANLTVNGWSHPCDPSTLDTIIHYDMGN